MFIKGERFSADFPLSLEDKRFLQQFTAGSEEVVLAGENLSRDQRKVVSALKEYEQTGVIKVEALKEKLSKSRQKLADHWADSLGVERFPHRDHCLQRLTGARLSDQHQSLVDSDDVPPAWDHGEIWSRAGEPAIAVSQPYSGMIIDHLEEFNDFASTHNLRFRISNYPSWYYPGSCWFMEWHQYSDSE